jgi:perosamine synthetase
MVVTDSDDLAEKCRSLKNLCFNADERFVHKRLGWNMRMTNLQAAIGLAQLERLDEFIVKKRSIGNFYNKAFENISSLRLPVKSCKYSNNIYWVYGMVIKEGFGLDAKKAMRELLNRNIGTRPFFYPMHLQPYFLKLGMFKGESYPVAENLYNRGFYIPSGLALTESQMNKVSNAILEIFE